MAQNKKVFHIPPQTLILFRFPPFLPSFLPFPEPLEFGQVGRGAKPPQKPIKKERKKAPKKEKINPKNPIPKNRHVSIPKIRTV
ncbi:MAG: hypothetical protein KDC55_12655 [Ignavibacteriae bacterium]|nr:hypothetical protein [Ignavibacteriota bacterium]